MKLRRADKEILRTRELVAAGLPVTHVCILLEDEFGAAITEDELQVRMRQRGIVWPGHIGRRAA